MEDKIRRPCGGVDREGGGVLPLPFFRDIGVVTAAKRENREKVRLIVEIGAQPAPGGVVSRCQLGERSGSKFRIACEKSRNFECVHIADRTEAATPGIAVSIRSEEVPPKPHLLL